MQSVLKAGKFRIAVCGHLLVQRFKGTDKIGERHLYQQSGITYVCGMEVSINQLREKEKAIRETGRCLRGLTIGEAAVRLKVHSHNMLYACSNTKNNR